MNTPSRSGSTRCPRWPGPGLLATVFALLGVLPESVRSLPTAASAPSTYAAGEDDAARAAGRVEAQEAAGAEEGEETVTEETGTEGGGAPEPETPPIFRMYDGTKISGFPEVDQVTVDTPYGQLVVPRADLVRIRFAREKDPELAKRIQAEIERLESEEFEIREEATEKLRQFGADALKHLREAARSEDEEVKSRAETLIKEIEEEEDAAGFDMMDDEDAVPIEGEDDEVVTVRFVIKGRVLERVFAVQSNYGDLKVDRKDIISVVFQEFTPTDAEVNVPANYFAPQNNWFESKLAVKKGDRIRVEARGQIQLLNYGWSVGPEGTTNIGGNHFKNFPVASLVARVGKKGKPFLVGPQYKGKADSSGKIMFALAFRGGNVSGSFNVKIQVKRDEDG